MLYPLWDPEGLLSTVPAIATALCGVFAGDWLKVHGAAHRAWWLWAAGAAATAVGLLWNRALPINKNLWTSSYALFSAGVAAQVLAICHWTIDVKKWSGWSRPFVAFGRNPLAAHSCRSGRCVLARWSVAGSVSVKAWLYRSAFLSWLRPCCGSEAAALGYAVAYVALWGVVVMWMHRRRVFIGSKGIIALMNSICGTRQRKKFCERCERCVHRRVVLHAIVRCRTADHRDRSARASPSERSASVA